MFAGKGLIKPYSSQFGFISRVLDSCLIVTAILLVGWFNQIALTAEYWLAGLLAGLLHQVLAEFTEIYRSWRSETLWQEAKQVNLCWLMGFALVLFLGQVTPLTETLLAWPQSAQWFAAVLAALLCWRLVLRVSLRLLRDQGYNSRTAAIVGTGELAQRTARHILSASWSGYKIQGFYDDRQSAQGDFDACKRVCAKAPLITELVGSYDKLIERAEAGELDCVYIALPMRAERRIQELIDRLSNSTATVHLVPDLFVFELLHARSVNLNGLPTISLIGEPMRGLKGGLKRLEDIFGSLAILSLIAWPMLAIAAAVKLTSKGPVFFKQQRYGLDGKAIEVWKFRSMKVHAEQAGTITQASKNDSRITPLGNFLRRTSLDELPQFINVLQGRMSIVGPRPHAVAHNEEYRGQIKSYMRRHKIKPGITGWAQVNGWRGETDTLDKMQKRIEHDLHYIQHWSVWWDLKIIIKTVFKGFGGKNAY